MNDVMVSGIVGAVGGADKSSFVESALLLSVEAESVGEYRRCVLDERVRG